MKLFFKNLALDANKEHELFPISEFGFTAVIVLKDNTIEVRNNLTEIHHLFDCVIEKSIAFESDIHSTGGTMNIDKIDTVVIFEQEYLAKDYYGN
jgi:hypothetical protein